MSFINLPLSLKILNINKKIYEQEQEEVAEVKAEDEVVEASTTAYAKLVTATGFGTPSTSDNRRMFTQALLEAAESPESAPHKVEVSISS